MLGIGRFGGIAGSYLVAELTGLQLGFAGIFSIVAIAGLIAALALVIKQLAQPEHESRYAPSKSAHLAH
jgi:AAHS family 4-hydroxybenzoate transporter-like MFS transporter